MNKERKVKCPNCGEEGLPRLWLGYNPPRCDKCGHQAEKPKLEC